MVPKTTWMVLVAPTATVPRLHINAVEWTGPTGGAGVQVAPLTDVTLKVSLLVTKASVTTTFCASDGPRLTICMSQEELAELVGAQVFVSCRSADPVTRVFAVEVSLAELGANLRAALAR